MKILSFIVACIGVILIIAHLVEVQGQIHVVEHGLVVLHGRGGHVPHYVRAHLARLHFSLHGAFLTCSHILVVTCPPSTLH